MIKMLPLIAFEGRPLCVTSTKPRGKALIVSLSRIITNQ